MVALLHNIRSLHNVGSIFRTADAAGIGKLYLVGITPEPVDRFGRIRSPIAKVSLGAEKTVPWEKVAKVAPLIRRLKDAGYQIVAVEQDRKAIPYFKFHPRRRERMAILLGHETRGLSPSVLRLCDTIVEIPMRGRKESLNVAVAFGIAAFHFLHGA